MVVLMVGNCTPLTVCQVITAAAKQTFTLTLFLNSSIIFTTRDQTNDPFLL